MTKNPYESPQEIASQPPERSARGRWRESLFVEGWLQSFLVGGTTGVAHYSGVALLEWIEQGLPVQALVVPGFLAYAFAGGSLGLVFGLFGGPAIGLLTTLCRHRPGVLRAGVTTLWAAGTLLMSWLYVRSAGERTPWLADAIYLVGALVGISSGLWLAALAHRAAARRVRGPRAD